MITGADQIRLILVEGFPSSNLVNITLNVLSILPKDLCKNKVL